MLEPSGALSTDGVFSLNEDVLCVYADLDALIEKAGLTDSEKATVEYLMQGYALADIADHFGKTRQTFEILEKRAVKKIVRKNNEEWEAWSGARLDDD